jgi:hypothetical protein
MGLIQCVVKKRRCKSHVAQITFIEANFPSIKTMNFSLCVGFPRADPFDFFIDLAKALRLGQNLRPISVRHCHERGWFLISEGICQSGSNSYPPIDWSKYFRSNRAKFCSARKNSLCRRRTL